MNWFTTLTLAGAFLLALVVVAHREGVRAGRVWPLYVTLFVLAFVIGATWPTGAA